MVELDDSRTNKEHRTFATRVAFIRSVFMDKQSQEEILKSSITYKLNISYETYLENVENSIKALLNRDPIKVMNKANKEN